MDPLIIPAARLYAALAGGVVLFQIALVLGAPFGSVTMGGRWPGRLPYPARGLSVRSIGLMLWTASVWIGASGVGPTQPPLGAEWVAFAIAGLSVVLNAMTPSAPERRLWLPVSAVLWIAASVVMFRG